MKCYLTREGLSTLLALHAQPILAMLEDKLWHILNSLEQKSIKCGRGTPEVVTDTQRKTSRERWQQSKEIIDWL